MQVQEGHSRKLRALAALVATAAIAAIAIGFVALRGETSASAGRARPRAEELEQARPSPPVFGPGVALVAAPGRDRSAASAEQPGLDAEPPEATEGTSGEAGAEETTDETMNQHASELFQAETPDRAWAGAAELSLQSVLREHAPPGTRSLRVECRSTLCRIDLEHESAESRESLIRSVPAKLPWGGPLFSPAPSHAGGRLRSSIYIAREGFPIEGIAE